MDKAYPAGQLADDGSSNSPALEGGLENSSTLDSAACCRYKKSPRDAQAQRLLQNRLNRMIGQLNGIKSMLEDNRYCGDILNQVAAVGSALQSFGYLVLQDHLQTCVVEEILQGNNQIVDEALDLMKKLK